MEEASSSDDDSASVSSSQSSSSEAEEVKNHRKQTAADLASSDSDDSSSEEENDDDSENDSDENHKDLERDSLSSSSDDGNSPERDEIDQALPLADRIRLGEERGVATLKDRRERKSKALKIASKRLAQMKQKKREQVRTADKKKSKHAPTEASSKRSDFFKHKTALNESGIGIDVGAHRYKPRDPRISSLHGHLDVGHFEHNYAFLQEVRDKEIATLRQRITAWKASGRKGQKKRRELGLTQEGQSMEHDKEELKRLLQEKATVEREQVDRAAKHAVKKKLQQDVADGKRGVYFPKRKELKRMHLEAKFEEMRKRGGNKLVDKAVAKRRKKNKSKDAGLLGGKNRSEF